MLLGMSTIILKWSQRSDLIVFRYSCFDIGQSEPRVAYKSVAYEKTCTAMIHRQHKYKWKKYFRLFILS